MPPDLVEITCAHCLRRLDATVVPTDVIVCGGCGAILQPDLIHVVHHVSTTLKALPTDYHDDDPTPVESPVPLAALRERREG